MTAPSQSTPSGTEPMTPKFKLLSYRANETLATIERGANAAGEMPAVKWFPWITLRALIRKGYVLQNDGGDNVWVDTDLLTLTDLGREYRAWAKTKD